MADYLILEKYFDKKTEKNAGSKARLDINNILKRKGFSGIEIVSDNEDRSKLGALEKIKKHFSVYETWKQALNKDFSKNDVIILQFPIIIDSIFLFNLFKKIKRQGVTIVLVIHDLDILRKTENNSLFKNIRLRFEEGEFLKLADYIVCHNHFMKNVLINNGVETEKLVELQIFDYLLENDLTIDNTKYKKELPVVIAGNLSKEKSGYIYHLPEDVDFNLYGVNYEPEHSQKNVTYKGSYLPDELPQYLDGSFGLVWDGETSTTCAGVFGEYLKINNPHKTSLYLVSQLPVIIWKQSALAPFIEENDCGIAVDSLHDLRERLDQMSDDDYERMKNNVKIMSKKLSQGLS